MNVFGWETQCMVIGVLKWFAVEQRRGLLHRMGSPLLCVMDTVPAKDQWHGASWKAGKTEDEWQLESYISNKHLHFKIHFQLKQLHVWVEETINSRDVERVPKTDVIQPFLEAEHRQNFGDPGMCLL